LWGDAAREGPVQADSHEQARQGRPRARTRWRGATDERLAHVGPDPSVAAGRRRDHHDPTPQPPALTGPAAALRSPVAHGRERRRAAGGVRDGPVPTGPAQRAFADETMERGRPRDATPVPLSPLVPLHAVADDLRALAAARSSVARASASTSAERGSALESHLAVTVGGSSVMRTITGQTVARLSVRFGQHRCDDPIRRLNAEGGLVRPQV
jgi:hypothetical protein